MSPHSSNISRPTIDINLLISIDFNCVQKHDELSANYCLITLLMSEIDVCQQSLPAWECAKECLCFWCLCMHYCFSTFQFRRPGHCPYISNFNCSISLPWFLQMQWLYYLRALGFVTKLGYLRFFMSNVIHQNKYSNHLYTLLSIKSYQCNVLLTWWYFNLS